MINLFLEKFLHFKDFHFLPEEMKLTCSLTDASEVVNFIKIIIQIYKNKNIKVSIKYKLLGGKGFLKHDTEYFRTINFSNIDTLIIKDIKSWVERRGIIYHPEDPFSLSFMSIKVWICELKSSHLKARKEYIVEFFSGNSNILKLSNVGNVADAVYFHRHGRFLGNNDYISFPSIMREKNITNKKSFLELNIFDQIKISSEAGRKNSLFANEIRLIDRDKIEELVVEDFIKSVVLTYDRVLKYVQIARLCELDYKIRPIKHRNIESLENTILIFYDTEWTWVPYSKNIDSIRKPAFLSYCIVDGLRYVENKHNFKENCGYFKGGNAINIFFSFITNIRYKYKRKSIYCIAHNAAKIEHQFVVNHIVSEISKDYENYKLKFEHIDGTNIKSFWWRDINFVDSMLFFPGSLTDLTKSLNKKYFKMDVSKEELLSTDWNDPSEKMIEYAILDSVSLAEMWMSATEILEKIVNTESRRMLNYAMFKTGSAIVKWYLTRDGVPESDEWYRTTPEKSDSGAIPSDEHTIPASNFKIGWDTVEMGGLRDIIFFGGRTECFFLGTNKTYEARNPSNSIGAFAIKIDRVSSYPAEMVSGPIPAKVVDVYVANNLEELNEILGTDSKHIYLIYGKIKFKAEMKFPLLAYKTDKLLFPNFMDGTVDVGMWDFEYLAIKENIESVSGTEILKFTKYDGFRDKIKSLYEMRDAAKKNKDAAKSHVLKILMNSGYGSLALNPVRETSYLAKGTFLEILIKRYSDNCAIMEGSSNFKWVIIKERKAVNSMIFVAAYITARARFALWRTGMDLILKEKATLLMCDTDSFIFVDNENKLEYYSNKFKGESIGSWKLEGMTKNWEIAALKVYRFGDEIKYKGIIGTPEQLVKDGKITKSVEMEVWGRGRDGELTITKMKKRMSFNYTKGIPDPVTGKGFIKPFNL